MMVCLWAIIAYGTRHQTSFQEKGAFGKLYEDHREAEWYKARIPPCKCRSQGFALVSPTKLTY